MFLSASRIFGSVEDSYQEQTEIVRVNGKPGVMLRVLKMSSANTVEVVDNVIRNVPKLTGIPATVKLTVSFDQSSTYARRSPDCSVRLCWAVF